MLASSKWKERKESALDPLLKLVKAPRLADGDYSELVRSLAGRMADANIACVSAAANCIEALARGLRDNFGRYKASVIAPMLEKFKEKKQSVVDALSSCLDAVFETVCFLPSTAFGRLLRTVLHTDLLRRHLRRRSNVRQA